MASQESIAWKLREDRRQSLMRACEDDRLDIPEEVKPKTSQTDRRAELLRQLGIVNAEPKYQAFRNTQRQNIMERTGVDKLLLHHQPQDEEEEEKENASPQPPQSAAERARAEYHAAVKALGVAKQKPQDSPIEPPQQLSSSAQRRKELLKRLKESHHPKLSLAQEPPPLKPNPDAHEVRSRLSFLAQSKYPMRVQRAEKRMEEEEKEQIEKCTFRPAIHPAPPRPPDVLGRDTHDASGTEATHEKTNEGRKSSDIGRSASQRLYEEAEKLSAEKERARRENILSRERKYQFTPHIDVSRVEKFIDMSKHKPIHMRVNEIVREKKKAEEETAQQYVVEHPFAPQINPKSTNMVDGTARDDIVSRLHSRKKTLSARSVKHMDEINEEFEREHTFAPKVNQMSERLADNMFYGMEIAFIQRQELFRAAKRKREEETEHNLRIQYTHHPMVSETSDLLTKLKRLEKFGEEEETWEERASRLSREDSKKKLDKQKAIQEEYISQFSFQPTLSEESKKITANHHRTLNDMVRYPEKEKKLREARERKEEKFTTEHPFRPSLGRTGKFGESYRLDGKETRDLVVKMEAYEINRQKKLDRSRKQTRDNNDKECTFTPTVNPASTVLNITDASQLNNHLHKVEAARRLANEQREREERAFLTNVVDNPLRSQPFTIPKPFNLSNPTRRDYASMYLQKK
ncbi:hypothetical protein PROFUN_02518 [Planoprotostelium fungivorum]|uniref:Uncharacterized protein n=1 Tax=Planoprotostelium fungivorum TaxID=1890364 RepID=A0A2P6MP68_9EUKA|nr:hypothetical protein PROFUN_02518 [Planoprotostelium fungivorum]